MGTLVCIGSNSVFSHYHLASNGGKQGGVPSSILFCLCIDDMLRVLTASGVGCCMGSVFIRALAYADDIVLIAPLATAMHKLLSICDEYVDVYHVMFNAQKSKCMAFIPKNRFFCLDICPAITFV